MMAASGASGKGNPISRGGVVGGIAPPRKKVDAFPLMSFVKDNCKFGDDNEEPEGIFSETTEDVLRAAKNRRFNELLNEAAVSNSKNQQVSTSSDSDTEERKKALQRIHEMEWKRNQKDTWKVQQQKPVKEQDYGGFLRPLERGDVGEYFSGTRKTKQPKEHKRNRTVSEVQLMEDGKIMAIKGEATSKNNSKQIVTNLPLRPKVSVPSKGLPFEPGSPVSSKDSVWMQRSGSELFSNVENRTLIAYGVSHDEEEAIAIAIAESLRTAKEEQTRRINMRQIYDIPSNQLSQERSKSPLVQRPPPDPTGTVWDSDDETLDSLHDKPDAPPSSKSNDLFYLREEPRFVGAQGKGKSSHHVEDLDFSSKAEHTKSLSVVSLPQRDQKHLSPRKSCMSVAKSANADQPESNNVSEDDLINFRSKHSALETFTSDLKSPLLKSVLKTSQKTCASKSDDDSSNIKGRSSPSKKPASSKVCFTTPEVFPSSRCHQIADGSESVDLKEEESHHKPQKQQSSKVCEEIPKTVAQSQPEHLPCSYGEKPVRLPQSMPSLMMAMKSNKGNVTKIAAASKNQQTSEGADDAVGIPMTDPDIKIECKDELPSLPSKENVHVSSGNEQFDVNMNVEEKAEPNNKETEAFANPLSSVAMMMSNIPWQYPGIPPIFPSVLPQLNPEALNVNPQLISPVVSQMASQAQFASMQMMLLQQAMSCMPSIFPQPNQTLSVPQNITASALPASATLSQNYDPSAHLSSLIPNPMQFGSYGIPSSTLLNPNQPTQPGLFQNSTNTVPIIGKGRGRLNRSSNHAQ